MIVAKNKPIEEIIDEVKDFEKLLVVGCNECVTVCEAGGRPSLLEGAKRGRLRFARRQDTAVHRLRGTPAAVPDLAVLGLESPQPRVLGRGSRSLSRVQQRQPRAARADCRAGREDQALSG